MSPLQNRFGARRLAQWWREGAATAFLRTPDWSALHATPAVLAWLMVMPYLLGILLERLAIKGAATFYWPAFQSGWWTTVLTLWICWMLARAPTPTDEGEPMPPTPALFAMLAAQVLTIQIVIGLLYVPIARMGAFPEGPSSTLAWVAWLLPLTWIVAAQSKVLWQNSARSPVLRLGACVLLGAGAAFAQWSRPAAFWYPETREGAAGSYERLKLTQDVFERQLKLLPDQLQGIEAQRPGIVDVYAITYAPYADEDVFRRESAMVVDVLETRFDAHGRTLQLVNNARTSMELPWATPLNLKRAIEHIAARMDRDEDILLIHLTSHGARDGTLSTRHRPLTIDPLTPELLRSWLDATNIRYRIISISACYAGSWIEPMSNPDTLVMTAADRDHTSLGCGRGSELTYFGKAMFDEELRKTWSFADAHSNARRNIDQRERAAGKSDGGSNPQIEIGSQIAPLLARLASERAAAQGPPGRQQ